MSNKGTSQRQDFRGPTDFALKTARQLQHKTDNIRVEQRCCSEQESALL